MFSGGQQIEMNPYGQKTGVGGSIDMPGLVLLPMQPSKNAFGGVNMKITDPEEKKKFMNWQGGLAAGRELSNVLTTGFNYGLQGQQIDAQKIIAEAYYRSQETIAGLKQRVAMRQLDVQENGMYIQQEMHRAQISHEERMMKLEGSTRARIAQIQESGKTARARQLSVADAFSTRRSYFNGIPS